MEVGDHCFSGLHIGLITMRCISIHNQWVIIDSKHESVVNRAFKVSIQMFDSLLVNDVGFGGSALQSHQSVFDIRTGSSGQPI